MQKSRFTASKPSIFAIASDEKFIRHLVTSFHQRSLSQSQYQNDPTKPNFGTLTATTYGNGAKISSRYDDFNRVTGVVYGEETAPRYEYDYNAKGQVARVRDNLLNRTTQSEYDLANRPVRVKTAEVGQHVYTGQVAYDNVYGNLSEFTEKVGENRQEFGTKFGYDDENRPTSLTYSASGKEIGQSTTTIDKLNRTTFSAVKLGSKTFTSEYHFAAGGYGTGSVTNLVASITQPGCNCGYGYDDNGNIASATLNGKWTGYTYDELGQLIQVNDHSDTRSGENGTTWKYTYDLGGNILKKERFAYADTTNPLETVTYTYGDANWRDKLTAVNGSTIRYDAIGNPLNDGTWTYTWQNGRQLQKMQKAGVTAEFVYNADGLRVQKTVNGVATKYTLHGKNVVHMTSGTDELHFFYDAQNRPVVVVYNGTAYAYVKSLQGDIVAILDENGNMVVSYGYDAWGAPLWCTGELAETLGKVQPFRYRGYVLDEETGLYYLRSRYYNPQWGRFVNADIKIGNSSELICGQMFAYCGNSPIAYNDREGKERENVLFMYDQQVTVQTPDLRNVTYHLYGVIYKEMYLTALDAKNYMDWMRDCFEATGFAPDIYIPGANVRVQYITQTHTCGTMECILWNVGDALSNLSGDISSGVENVLATTVAYASIAGLAGVATNLALSVLGLAMNYIEQPHEHTYVEHRIILSYQPFEGAPIHTITSSFYDSPACSLYNHRVIDVTDTLTTITQKPRVRTWRFFY